MEGEAPTICRWKVIDAVMVYGQHHRHPRPTSRSSRPPSPRESAVVVPDRLPRPLGHRPLVACPADGKAWRVGAAVWEVGRWLPRCRIAAATARARCSISARPSTMKASRRSVTIPRICRWRRAADGQHLRPPASTRVSTPRRQKTPAPPSPPSLHLLSTTANKCRKGASATWSPVASHGGTVSSGNTERDLP